MLHIEAQYAASFDRYARWRIFAQA
jgi:hypothetical protein